MKYKIGVIGIGYVGLPLAVHLSSFYEVIGYDINEEKIEALKNKRIADSSIIDQKDLDDCSVLFSATPTDLCKCNIYIICVPTPIDGERNPLLDGLIDATEMVGDLLGAGDIVVYESTVYPGCTRENCIPLLEAGSNLKEGSDFFVLYSPERINPGDSSHSLKEVVKVIGGSSAQAVATLQEVYGRIISAGTYVAESIEVAEAAKVIENVQRDVNIALTNDLYGLFQKLDINIHQVLAAAATKWNFIKFQPGLVGGHCIGVDPYYLIYRARQLDYDSRMILAGREMNEGMLEIVADRLRELMSSVRSTTIAIVGCAFKENVGDCRNAKSLEISGHLERDGFEVLLFDELVVAQDIFAETGGRRLSIVEEHLGSCGVIFLPFVHDYVAADTDRYLLRLLTDNGVVFDLKGGLKQWDCSFRIVNF